MVTQCGRCKGFVISHIKVSTVIANGSVPCEKCCPFDSRRILSIFIYFFFRTISLRLQPIQSEEYDEHYGSVCVMQEMQCDGALFIIVVPLVCRFISMRNEFINTPTAASISVQCELHINARCISHFRLTSR